MSEWKQSGLDRRDFRATKAGPEESGPPRRRKDTKKWCRGKEGTEHEVVGVYDHAWRFCFCHAVCQVCNKRMYRRCGAD